MVVPTHYIKELKTTPDTGFCYIRLNKYTLNFISLLNKGEEITRYFIDENDFAVDLNSFNKKYHASVNTRTLTEI